MYETEDRAKAYAFDLQASQSMGALRIGWRKLKVLVTQYSWEGYTIVVRRSTARLLKPGQQGTLEFQGSNYKVSFLDSKSVEEGMVEVRLQLIDCESPQQNSKKKKRCAGAASVSLNHKDPILGTATWICLLMLLMVLPGWGEGWGTSAYLSNGFRSVFVNVCDVCNCLLGR